MTDAPDHADPATRVTGAAADASAAAGPEDHLADEAGVAAYDVLLDERGRLCPIPVIALARAVAADPSPSRVLLLADDPAAVTDIPAWCGMRGRHLEWTGPAPDGHGRAYLVTTRDSADR